MIAFSGLILLDHLPVNVQADFLAVGHRDALQRCPVIVGRVLNSFFLQKYASKTLAALHRWEKREGLDYRAYRAIT